MREKTKVILINPPQKQYKQSYGFNVYFPIGLLNLAAMIQDICDVKILDCLVTEFNIKKTKDYTLYGMTFGKIKETLKRFNPDIVGISIPYPSQLENAKIISKICKEYLPNAKIIFGGAHVSVSYQQMLNQKSCDFCVVGEGEETFKEFVKKFNSNSQVSNIRGLAYKGGKKIYFKHRLFLNDLDTLPYPAYDLIQFEDYLKHPYLYKNRSSISKNSISIITSRGCPYSCIFCSVHLHMGRKFRYHSPDYIIQHLRFCIENYGIRNFHFEDDNISFDKIRFERLLDKIIDEKLKINWDIPNGIRTDTLDFDLLKKIKRSGCSELAIAIESGNQKVLNDIIKKKTSLVQMLMVVRYCKILNIKLRAFYVIGFPGETIKQIKETLDLALKLYKEYSVQYSLMFATPLYGTELYNICIKNRLIKKNLRDDDFAKATQTLEGYLITPKEFSKAELLNILSEFHKRINKQAFNVRGISEYFDRVMGKLGIFLEQHNPKLYFKLIGLIK